MKLCRQQSEGILDHDNENVGNIGQEEGLNFAAISHTTVKVIRLPL
jgi:hypothetical protein